MKISISSMIVPIKQYRANFEGKFDWDKHYRASTDEMGFSDELVDIEVDTIEQLFDLFSEIEDTMGGYGHIVVDVKNNSVLILDTYID